MNRKYFKWEGNNNKPRYGCVLERPTGIKKLGPLWKGESVAAEFPAVEFAMSPDFPDHTILADHLNNQSHLIIASDSLTEFFKGLAGEEAEFLPVTIRDHKGKKAATYTIVHPLGTVDCLDREASGAVTVPGSETVMSVDHIVLKKSTMDGSRQLVRVGAFPEGLLVRDDVAAAIEKAGFAGILFEEVAFS